MNIRYQFLAAVLIALLMVVPLARADDSPPLQWALAFENDLLAGDQYDRDYTYGINLAFVGPQVERLPLQPSGLRETLQAGIEQWLPEASGPSLQRSVVEYGLYGFTPDDIAIAVPQTADRPYASLIYAQSSGETIDLRNNSSWSHSLSVGVLGLDFVGGLQRGFHSLTDSNDAKGWRHQISDGGELTAKYSLAHQRVWSSSNNAIEFKTTTQASLGYISEASYGISIRAGKIRSPWWSFKPEFVSYGERSNINFTNSWVAESFFWAGLSIKVRAYNAFLQGQFRHSEHTFNSDQLHHTLVEAWLGYTIGFHNGYRISYGLRGHSSEIKSGTGDRHLVWGSLVVSKAL